MFQVLKDLVGGAPVRSLGISTVLASAYDVVWPADVSSYLVLVLAGLTAIYAHRDEKTAVV